MRQQDSLWMTIVLLLAGAHSFILGILTVAWPGILPAANPDLLRTAGMVPIAFATGYWITASAPVQHWSLILVGLLSKLSVSTSLFLAVKNGVVPWNLGTALLASELVWVLPFLLILRSAFGEYVGGAREAFPEIQRMALQAKTQFGVTLLDMTTETPVLLVFLRHTGCTFCREALADLAERRNSIEAMGTRIALVHMSPDQQAARLFAVYELDDLPRVSDPRRHIYRAFGLGRGDFLKLFGPRVWWRGFESTFLNGHRIGRMVGDGFQMPGIFLLFHGEVLRSYRHQSIADRPDYQSLADAEQFPA